MVTMWQAFINFWKGYVNFTGRSTRAEFWWMRLWSTIIFFVWLILFVIALVSDSSLISKVDKFSQPNVQGIENWKLMSELLSAPGADVKIMDRFFRYREVPDSENFSKPGFQLKTA